MAKIELYTFGEIIKLLGITSNELNVLIDTKKLKPVRHQGRLKFKKDDVEILKREREKPVDRYSWDEVLRELQIEEEELQRMVSEGEVQIFQEQFTAKFDKNEIDAIKHSRQVDATIVVEQQVSRDFLEEIPSMQVPQEELSELSYSIETKQDSGQEYYRFSQVLSELQIEAKELERMLASGELSAFHDKGELKFLKPEIDFIKNERMVDATMVVEAQSGDIQVEEESIQPILISATGTESIPRQSPHQDEFYTFDEAVYELQIEPGELKRMIAKQELEAVKDGGQLKFRKKDIDNRAQKIEPTVILPEEEQQAQEDTIDLLSEEPVEKEVKPATTVQLNKSFYSLPEAANILELDDFDLQNFISQGIITTYRYEGEQKIKRGDLLRFLKSVSNAQPDSVSPLASFESAPKKQTAKPKSPLASPPKPLTKPASPPREPVVVAKPLQPPQPEYYTIQEVISLLQTEERDIKKMVARGQLKVTRFGKTYHFSKEQVDDIIESRMLDATITVSADEFSSQLQKIEKRPPAPAPRPEPVAAPPPQTAKAPHSRPVSTPTPPAAAPPERPTVTLKEVLKMLSLNKSDIKRLIEQNHLTPLPGNCFYRDQVESLKSNEEVELTMVLPLFNEGEDEEDDEDELAYLSAPIPKPQPRAPIPKPQPRAPIPKPQPRAPIPKPQSQALIPQAQPVAADIDLDDYYTFKQALNELQLESNELEQLIRKGELQCIRCEGQRWLEKISVEDFKKGKMIEPTIMVGSDSDDILEDDDDDDMFLIK